MLIEDIIYQNEMEVFPRSEFVWLASVTHLKTHVCFYGPHFFLTLEFVYESW